MDLLIQTLQFDNQEKMRNLEHLISKTIVLLLAVQIAVCEASSNQKQHVTEGDKPDQFQQIPGAGLSIVFIFGGLLYSGIMMMISRTIKVPINPLLLISGILFGSYHENLYFVGQSFLMISRLNPNGILAIFLPALIFESAFKSQWHMLKKQIEQTLILGFPCVILASFLIMTGIKLALGYEQSSYTWLQAFLLGCILCCTDIFSFVNKLRQYGAPQRIISLIEGESLFNYCSCLLIFQLINQVVIDYDNYSIFTLMQIFLQQTIGGLLFGLISGLIALFVVKRISQDGVLVVTIMVTFCYAIYLFAEFSELRVSGIISVVTFGIFMSAFGKPRFIGEAAQFMESFWSYAVFIAETSIFLIAGVLVGVNIFSIKNIFDSQDIKAIFLIYLLVLLSRYLAIVCFQGILSNLGYGLQWKQSIAIAFSGLKGAVGISFAMIVYENDRYTTQTSNSFLLHVASNSLLTLLINGTMSGLVIKALKLSNITKVEYKFYQEYLQQFESRIEDKKQQLKGQKSLENMQWDEIDEKIGIKEFRQIVIGLDSVIEEASLNYDAEFDKKRFYCLEEALKEFANRNNSTNNMTQNQLQKHKLNFYVVVQIRRRFIKSLKFKIWSYREEYKTMPDAAMLLIQAANFDLDTRSEELESWSWIKNQFSSNIKFVTELRRAPFIGSIARDYLFSYVTYCYDVVSSYISVNQEVRKEFREAKFVSKNNYENAMKLILRQSQENQKEAQNFLQNYLKPSFPEIQAEVKTRKVSFSILFSFQEFVERFYETGQLQQSEFEIAKRIINQKKLSLQLMNPKWKVIPVKQALKNDLAFGLLPQKILSVLQQNLTTVDTYGANQIIYNNFDIARYIYLIRRGGCTAQFINGSQIYKQNRKVNDIFGVQAMVSSNYHSTITTHTLMVIVGLKRNHIQKIMDYFLDFQQAFWKNHLFILLKLMTGNRDLIYYFCNHYSKKQLITIFNEKFTLKRVDTGVMQIQQDSIFLRGSIGLYDAQEEEYTDVPPITIFLAEENPKIKVMQKSSFMVGSFQLKQLSQQFFMPDLTNKKSSKQNGEKMKEMANSLSIQKKQK